MIQETGSKTPFTRKCWRLLGDMDHDELRQAATAA
jgi:hypothetical protein